jgi:1-acyl-sn-glycerol-3-phosphate acyltransferase
MHTFYLSAFGSMVMFLNGYVKLKRGDKASIKQMIIQCEKLLSQNVSIMLFPEGTRSKTGIVKPINQ